MSVNYFKEQLGNSILSLKKAFDVAETEQEKSRISKVLLELCMIYEGELTKGRDV